MTQECSFCTIEIDEEEKTVFLVPKAGFTIFDLDHNPDDLESVAVEFDSIQEVDEEVDET